MAEFKSVYPGLGFYVDGQFYKFRNGRLRTNDEQVITKLEKLSGVERVDKPEPKEEPKKEKKEQPKQKAKTKKK